MTKQFYLYLDESGDFDKDLLEAWKNECLVGGLLVKDSPVSDTAIRSVWLKSWKKIFPDDKNLSEEAVLKKIRHSTELEEQKKDVVCEILNQAEQMGEFVIFQNYNKARIINSTVTYVNIMADGIVQLLSRLVLENPHDRIQIHVIAGFRKDTTSVVTDDPLSGYIDKNECTDRIRERIVLLSLKNNNILSNRSSVSFEYMDDKRTMPLILSDYICNFYYTNTARIYRNEYESGDTYQQHLLKKYHGNNIFNLYGNSERERMMSYLSVQDYSTALYEVCAGLIRQPENRESLLQAFVRLPSPVQENYLKSFDNYINNMVGVERRLTDDTLEILEHSIQLFSDIQSYGGINTAPNIFSLYLYELAVYNHRGELSHMKNLFEKCKGMVGSLIHRGEYLDYIFMFYNRYAVYLIDNFNVESAFELIGQVWEAFEGLELAVASFPYQSEAEDTFSYVQLGKLLGTQVQCCHYMMKQKKIVYEEAAEISNLAISNFSDEFDKRRQYQYRADIEATAGHYKEAWEYLKKGFGFSALPEFFETKDIFALYHLSYLMRQISEDEMCRQEIKVLLERFDKTVKNLKPLEFPSFLIIANTAETMAKCGKERQKIKSLFQKACMTDETTEPLFQILKLCIQAEALAWMIQTGDRDIQKQKDEMKKHCENLSMKLEGFPESIIEMADRMKKILEDDAADIDMLTEYSKLRQY